MVVGAFMKGLKDVCNINMKTNEVSSDKILVPYLIVTNFSGY